MKWTQVLARLLPVLACMMVLAPLARGWAAAPCRVVSLVPSLTETLCALGAERQLVGRSRYCLNPASLRRLPEVGGYLDPAWEALMGLRPDLVLLTPESRETRRRLLDLQVPVLELSQNRLEEILSGMERLGQALGRTKQGKALADSLRRDLSILGRRAPTDAPPLRVLLVAGRSPEPGAPRDLWVIGQGSWLSDLLALLGAVNAVGDLRPSMPAISREGLLALDPDWIIELWPEDPLPRDTRSLERDWNAWRELRAVAGGRVRALSDDRLIVPGPRIVEAARLLDAVLRESP